MRRNNIDAVDAREATAVASTLHGQLDDTDDSRRELSISLRRMSIALRHPRDGDEWYGRLEDAATSVRVKCERFQQASRSQHEIIIGLNHGHGFSKARQSDSVRQSLANHSLAATMRLQMQLDEQLVGEIVTFLSNLYVDGGFDEDSEEYENQSTSQSHDNTIRSWIECLEKPVLLQSASCWMESLRGRQSSEASDTSNPRLRIPRVSNDGATDEVGLATNELSSQINPLVESNDVSSAVDLFLTVEERFQPHLTFLLVVGSPGTGKTFLCDEIERRASVSPDNPVQVLRPMLPIDVMGASLGETEDTMASIFGLARTCSKCIIVLDDIDNILCQENNVPSTTVGNVQAQGPLHSRARLQSWFLANIDSLRSTNVQSSVLVVGTATNSINDSVGRVDKVFALEAPTDIERRELISSFFKVQATDPAIQSLFRDLVDCTVGRSRSEIVQYCRQAVSSCGTDTEETEMELLFAMKASLQTLAPESIRTGVVSDFVDMKVLAARDLAASSTSTLPLFGQDAELAWKELEALIVMPLCQARALDELLYGESMEFGKTVCGGVLLTGQPGCGKSALAYHCASVVANLLPSVSLLDVSCTSLVHKEVGGSERAVRHLFASARAAAPCILLMDGIENIAAVRGHDYTTEGTMDRILSTLLIELDGVDGPSNSQGGKIAVIGITHNERWIDSALRRPGRLERVVKLSCPDYDARYQIVMRELQTLMPSTDTPSSEDIELANFVARRTDGLSGAEVIATCSEARMASAREHVHEEKKLALSDRRITRDHFVAAGLVE